MTDMAGKTALITGATGGIGRATAAAFVSRGANVVLADLDRAALDEMAAAIGPQAAVAVCDVTDRRRRRRRSPWPQKRSAGSTWRCSTPESKARSA